MPANKASTQHDEDITNGDQEFPNYASTSTKGRTPVNDLLQMMATQQKLLVDLLQKMSTSAVTQQESQFDRMARRIDKFSYDPDQDDCFNLWYNRHKDIFDIDCEGMEEKTKTRLLVSALDAVSHTRFSRFILPKEPSELNWSETLEALKTLFGTKKSLFRRRFECFRMNFSPNEDIDNFVNSLKARTLEANFKGIRHETLECLALVFAFQAPELADYRKSVKDDSKIVEVFNAPEVRAVRKKKRHHQSRTAKARSPPSPCPICQQNHWKKHCPQNRHATSATQQSKATSQRRTKQSSPRTWYQRLIGRTTDIQKYLKVHINGHPTRLQLDTGADVTIISRPTWMQLGGPQLQKTSDTLRGANGLPLRIYGKFDAAFLVIDNRGKAHPGQGVCYVSDDNDLLGITLIEQIPDFNLVLKRFNVRKVQTLNHDALRDQTITKLRRDFASVFEPGLGCCLKAKATLQLRPDSHPVFIKKRPVPYASLALLDAEIDRLVAQKSSFPSTTHYGLRQSLL
uniref:Peptidase A2 domain-containing protein n=1 Tax=Haemonchus contortus TaxID=6289 RepID=A0A7I4YU52_HAECO